MAKAIETLSIKLDFKDAGVQQVINKVKSSFKGLEQVVSGNTKPAIQKLRTEINTFASTGNRSISTIDAQVTALRALRREADINSTEFKQLTADISKFERQLGKAQGRRPSGGGRALAATQMAGAAISGGIFGGPEGFLGAVGGGALGGVPGAFAGAAIGAQVGMIRQSLGGVAETVAEINSMKIALAGVSESAEDYQKSFANVISISEQFLFPVDKAIGEFTKLKAAVVGAGFGTEETTDVFKGFAAAILATGGNSEKLSGALLAASQVFSKNKVQAEELRGQIGERLPGAFSTFAQSIGVSSAELDDMLRKGEVSTENFVEFTRTLFARYERTAETLGSAPEKAGQRLELALSIATLKFGGFFQKVGAGFQDYVSGLVNLAIENEKKLKLMAAKFLAFGEQIATTIKRAVTSMIQTFKPFFDFVGRGLSAVFDRVQMAQREIAVRKQGADPMKIYGGVLSGFKEQEGIGGPGNFGLSIKQKEEVQRRYSQALAAFLGEESLFNESVDKYLGMMGEFQPGSNLIGTSLGDPQNLLTGGGGTGDGGTPDTAAESLAKRQKALYEKLLPQLTKVNQLLNEGNKFEQERINIRFKAAALVKQVKEGIEESRQAELLALVEQNKQDAIRNVNLDEQRQKLEDMFSMDFAGQFKTEQSKIQEFISNAEDSLKDLQQVAINVSQGIGNAVGNALTNGITGLIEGTKNAKEVFADFLKSVGQILAQEGAKMIATYIAIGVAKAFAGLLGGGGKFETAPLGTDFASPSGGFGGLTDFGLFGKANGGPVNAGRPYMVGERGPELFVPGQSGGIMRNEDMRRMMGSSPVGSQPSMNFTFETTSIGGTEYVSREQLESAMAATRRQAASDGAKRGMNMTLDRMQNSPRTRARVGIS
jgi:tape measure domain-containing protein